MTKAPTNRTITRCAIALLVFPCMLGCGAIADIFTGPSNTEYRASGSAARVSLTYQTEDGTEQIGSTALPWAYSRKADDGDFLSVSAQIIEGGVLDTVTVQVYKGGDIFKTATSSGLGSIATASGTLD